MKKAWIMAVILGLVPAAAQANVTLNVSAGILYKVNGATPINNATIVLLQDTDNDHSFGALTDAVGSFKADAGDDIVGIWEADDFGGFFPGTSTYVAVDNKPLNTPLTLVAGGPPVTLIAGRDLALVFYDMPFTPSLISTGPGANKNFGFYTDATFRTPNEGATVNLNFLTQANGGTLPETAGRANLLTVVPEPASGMLALAGAGLMMMSRRKRRNI